MDSPSSEQLVSALKQPAAYSHAIDAPIQIHETHISWVFLAGDYAYKVKKPITTDFLDYSTFKLRQHYCQEELRLNQRYAPGLYIGVAPIVLDGSQIRVVSQAESTGHDPNGRTQIVEHAVQMHRFPEDALLNQQLSEKRVKRGQMLQLAQSIAHFHQATEVRSDHRFGQPTQVWEDAIDNLTNLAQADLPHHQATIAALDGWTRAFFDRYRDEFIRRQEQGLIRECHGDLHTSNIVFWDGQFEPFDGIEFCQQFHWIDVLSDIGFLTMDLKAMGHDDLAFCLLNRYLEITGDYESLQLLRWYEVYRALVRAKVDGMRLEQCTAGMSEIHEIKRTIDEHLNLAARLIASYQPSLYITHGLSGSGKTHGSQGFLERQAAIRIRSDIERKRLYHQGHFSEAKTDMYSSQASQTTYARLQDLAQSILQAGYSVVVDATFLETSRRKRFQALAEDLDCPFGILSFEADKAELLRRIRSRAEQGGDASDADESVLELQLSHYEPLQAEEHQWVVSLES